MYVEKIISPKHHILPELYYAGWQVIVNLTRISIQHVATRKKSTYERARITTTNTGHRHNEKHHCWKVPACDVVTQVQQNTQLSYYQVQPSFLVKTEDSLPYSHVLLSSRLYSTSSKTVCDVHLCLLAPFFFLHYVILHCTYRSLLPVGTFHTLCQ